MLCNVTENRIELLYKFLMALTTSEQSERISSSQIQKVIGTNVAQTRNVPYVVFEQVLQSFSASLISRVWPSQLCSTTSRS